MVRPYGPRPRRWRRRSRSARARGDRRHALRAGRRPEPAARHDRGAPRLGAVAPARLGRADRRLRRSPTRRSAALGRGGQRAHRRRFRGRGRRRLVRRRREGALPFGQSPMSSAWSMVTDILDVWFDSGSTHAFTLEDRPDLEWPADRLSRRLRPASRLVPFLAARKSCGTRGRAPYDTVLTHGFTIDEDGAEDVEVARQHGDAAGGHRAVRRRYPAALGGVDRLCRGPQDRPRDPARPPSNAYRKIRNTMRWMLGTLAHCTTADAVADRPCRSSSG